MKKLNVSHMDVLLAISQETVPTNLRILERAIHDRLAALAQINSYSLKVGDTVKFVDTIRPSYLGGLSAEIVAINRKSVVVSCPVNSRYGRFSGGKKVRVPLGLIAA